MKIERDLLKKIAKVATENRQFSQLAEFLKTLKLKLVKQQIIFEKMVLQPSIGSSSPRK